MTRPICITGMHRSGTSMVARAARELGVWLGDTSELVPPAVDNPDGFFEHARLVAIGEALQDELGGGWDCPASLPDGWRTDPRVTIARSRADSLIEELRHHTPWGWKDPRASVTVPLWVDLVPDVGIVLCVRNPLEVAASLRARNGTSLAFGLRLWMRYTAAALADSAADRRLVTHYDAWFHRPDVELSRLVGFIGTTPTARQMDAARTVPARHARHSRFDAPSVAAAGVGTDLRSLYRTLCEEAGWADGGASGDPSANGAERPASTPIATQPGDPELARVDRSVVEVGLARYESYKRNGRVAQLERQVAELQAELAMTNRIAGSIERLQASVYDTQLLADDVRARVHHGIDRESTGRDIAYAFSIRALREAVRCHVAADADVVVLTQRDQVLLDLHGRRARHFPVGPTPLAPGETPGTDAAAIAHLVAVRAIGATHLVVPAVARWWFDAFAGFADDVARTADVVCTLPDGATIHRFRDARDPDAWSSPERALDAARRRAGRHVAVLDWTASRLLSAAGGFAPLDDAAPLPYLDASIDVVAVDVSDPSGALDAGRIAEAMRVASIGVLHCGPTSTWTWTSETPVNRFDLVVLAAPGVPAVAWWREMCGSIGPYAGRVVVLGAGSAVDEWRAAIERSGTVATACVVAGGLAPGEIDATLDGDASDLVALVDSSSVPLATWLADLTSVFVRGDRVGVASAVRRAFAGMPVGAGASVSGDGRLVPIDDDGDPVTGRIDAPAPGAAVLRRALLAASGVAELCYRTPAYAFAAVGRAASDRGLDVLVRPTAEVVDLGLSLASAIDLELDRGRYVASPTAVAP